MALQGLLKLGIEAAVLRGGTELEELAVTVGHPREAGAHLVETLVAIPALLVAVDGALARHPDPRRVALWRSVVSYLLLDQDLIPTDRGSPLRGVLDDAYLLHRAAQEMRRDLPGFELHDLDGGTALLRSVLPVAVSRELDDRVARVLAGEQHRRASP